MFGWTTEWRRGEDDIGNGGREDQGSGEDQSEQGERERERR
jgi:hypothetical protein